MKRNFNVYIPEFVWKDGEMVPMNKLKPEDRSKVLRHGKAVVTTDIRKNYKTIVTAATSVMKFGGGFEGKEFLEFAKRIHDKGMVIAPFVKDANGGGRGARAWGLIHAVPKGTVENILETLDVKEEFEKLPPEKQLARITKFLGEMDELEHKPTVKIIPDFSEYEGLLPADDEWMAKNNLPFGIKATGPVKGLIVPKSYFINAAKTEMEQKIMTELLSGADIFVPESENKIKLSAEKLTKTIHVIRNITPEKRFSRNLKKGDNTDALGRNPTFAFDLQALLGHTPTPDLSEEKAFYEKGEWSEELLDNLFGFDDKKTEPVSRKLRREGELIKNGVNPHDPEVRDEAMKALWTRIRTRLQGKLPGIYGVAMPISLLPVGVRKKRGYITRYPWIFPILADYAIHEHCIFLDTELMKMFGGDFDGDQIAVFHRKRLDTGLVYPNMKGTLKEWMKMPEKTNASHGDKPQEEVIAYILGQYAGCGRIFNAGKIVVDTARAEGWTQEAICELDAKITGSKVQTYINGFKNAGCEEVPSLSDLAGMFNVPAKRLNRQRAFYRALRSPMGGIDMVVESATDLNADPKSPAYYERTIAINFKDWEYTTSADMEAKNMLKEVL